MAASKNRYVRDEDLEIFLCIRKLSDVKLWWPRQNDGPSVGYSFEEIRIVSKHSHSPTGMASVLEYFEAERSIAARSHGYLFEVLSSSVVAE